MTCWMLRLPTKWLLQTTAGHRIEQRIFSRLNTLQTVSSLDVELVQVLRRLVREGSLTAS